MYQQTQFDPALLSLMEVAKKVTPQGQPTVAANMMAKAGVPPQKMPPGPPQGMPPGMPPQGPPQQGLPDLLQQAQQAAPSVAQNMQEQQTAQMLAQAQQKPPMMAEGGIASLPMDDYGYADGGIIGYAAGGEFDLGDSDEARLRDEERVRLIKERQREEQKRLTAEMLGLPYDLPQQVAAPSPKRAPEQAPVAKPQVQRQAPQQIQPGLPSVLPSAPAAPTAASLYKEEQDAIKEREAGIKPAKTMDQLRAEKIAARRARGLPEDPTELARTQLTGIEALDAKRLALEEAQKAPRLQAGMLKGLLAPGAKTLGDVFRGSAEGILGAEETERAGNISSLERQRREMTLTNEMKASMQRAQYLELEGEFEESKKELDRALALKTKIEADRSALRLGRRGELATEEQKTRDRAAQLQAARIQAETRLTKPGENRAGILERYADNWEKLDPIQKMSLKDAGVTNFEEYVRMRDKMISGSGTESGGSIRPKTQEEFNALPKGSRYINPADGKEYIKN